MVNENYNPHMRRYRPTRPGYILSNFIIFSGITGLIYWALGKYSHKVTPKTLTSPWKEEIQKKNR
eukprot:TRINITY_DN136303_c0_g1_i1.p2 TRINITY_DN136303_c0_g1~~TRINITY_DN136303_c0_g1_i1.p2  ORF type:complete len:65 (-),score=8.53 TRINITY_DN136303_c0_g1_i1:286-480(-)